MRLDEALGVSGQNALECFLGVLVQIAGAAVMETIRTLGKEITIDLRWNGARLIITPQTALQRPARKAFWTLSQLCEEYAR